MLYNTHFLISYCNNSFSCTCVQFSEKLLESEDLRKYNLGYEHKCYLIFRHHPSYKKKSFVIYKLMDIINKFESLF